MDSGRIDDVFREAVRNHPKEAKSHFEIVDPGVWRYDVAGRLSGLGKEWVGPYQYRDDGVEYDAYGLRTGILASQMMFLEDLGIVAHPKGFSKPTKIVVSSVIGICVLVAISLYYLHGDEDNNKYGRSEEEDAWRAHADKVLKELHAKSEHHRTETFAVRSQSASAISPPKPQIPKAPSIKERARAAFRASRWAEAIDLVDQLTEEEADAELRYYIGLCYKEGHAIEHDYAEAFRWFKSSAEMGNTAAQYELGQAYEKGNGVAVDFGQALKWYDEAARLGNAMATLSLGLMYEEGRGVVQNPAEAAEWYRKASDLGNAHAGYLLGLLYYDGRGVPQSYSSAAELYRKAGSAGHAHAGFLLGKMYETGTGINQSTSEALYWYKKAGELGHSEALSEWQRLSNTDKMWLHPKK